MFKQLKELVQQRYNQLAQGESHVFYKDIDRDKIWEVYLSGFTEAERQSHNCNCCKSFLRQFGGITFIKNNRAESIWELSSMAEVEEYRNSTHNVLGYVRTLPITNVFLPETKKIGTAKNFDPDKQIYWEHFALELGNVTLTSAAERDSKAGLLRTGKETLKRALDELTIDSLDVALELIAQNSLYRGAEFKDQIAGFLLLKREYDQLRHGKDEFAWLKSVQNPRYNGIRGSVIGTFLEDLSVGIELDDALPRYEKKTAPANYKRPTAAITPRMVDEARKKLEELGFLDSLDRRFANSTDININNVIFADRSSELTDIFGELAKGTLVNPKTLSKTEEITIAKFLSDVVPSAKSIELLVENSHLTNLVSLITATNPEAKHMFKWQNPFSWSYIGGVTDSIKENVKAAGGNVEGVLRFSIQWNDEDTKGILDFDAHAHEPGGRHIYFADYRGSVKTPMTGNLDVDMRGHSGEPEVRVENITWTDIRKMKDGVYRFQIHNYNSGRNTGFKAQIEANGEIYNFHHPTHMTGYMDVAEVTLKNGVFTVQPKLEAKSSISSREKWGVKTNIFTKVKSIMLSPNHWDGQVGNKHFMFMLEGAVNNEEVRPFYNEFLNNQLNENRKVLEVMASKLKVPFTANQLSGIGFSDTQSNQIIARVSGNIKRNLKIKI